MTKTMVAILGKVAEHWDRYGEAPSAAWVGEEVGVARQSSYYHLVRLTVAGYLEDRQARGAAKGGGWRLTQAAKDVLAGLAPVEVVGRGKEW